MLQTFFSRICTVLAICAVPLAAYAENYDTWKDPAYNFASVRIIYTDVLDSSRIQTDTPMQTYRLKEDFQKKAGTVKGITILAPSLEPPAPSALHQASVKEEAKQSSSLSQSVEIKHAVASDPAASLSTDSIIPAADPPVLNTLTKQSIPSENSRPSAVTIPQEAIDAKADIYVTAQLLTYSVGTGLIPAHTEWNSYSVRDVYYDRDGHPHWFYHDVSYPVYVPDTYVPMATVSVRFAVYDILTGKLISYSEDTRTRSSSDDLRGVYNRIIDRFFKNLKKEIKG